MDLRTPLLGVACGVTTFLLVGAGTIEALATQYGGPGVGILGVFAGALGGLGVAVLVGVTADRLRGWAATAVVGYGAFGAGFLGVAALRYVNVPGADDLFAFPVHLATSLVVAVAAAALDHRSRPGRPSPGGSTRP